MKRFPLLPFLLLVLTLLPGAGCSRQSPTPLPPPSGRKIKIGVIGPFSGPGEGKGRNGLEGIKTAMALQPRLHNGDSLELVVVDDQNQPALTIRALRRLATRDQVAAIIILSSSDQVLRIASLADRYQTPILALLATHPAVTDRNHYISQLCFDDNFEATVAALYVRDELLIDRVAVFSNPGNAHSTYLATRFVDKFKDLDGDITATIAITGENADFATILQDIRASKTELLYLPTNARDLVRIIQALERLEWKPAVLVSDGLLSTVLNEYKEVSGLLEGVTATDFYGKSIPLTPYGKRIRRKFHQLYHDDITTYTALGAEGYAVLYRAADQCTAPASRACINQNLRHTVNFTGIMGKISIGPNGKASRPLIISTINEGRLQFLVEVF